MQGRTNGSLIAMETGQAITYSIDKLQDRGKFFIEPGDHIYAGQVIGEHTRGNDILINVIKTKKLSNMRATGSDDKSRDRPCREVLLEEAMEFIQGDEYTESHRNRSGSARSSSTKLKGSGARRKSED